MPLIRKATETQYETIPAGTYEVVCREVKPERWEEDAYGNFDKLRFGLEVQNLYTSEGVLAPLSGLCNDVLSEKSTLWSWLIAFGLTPSYEADIDIEACVGRRAMAQVSIKESKKDKGQYNKIEAMFPLPAGGFASGAGASAPTPPVIREDGSVNFIAFWSNLRAVNITQNDLINTFGLNSVDEMRAHLVSLSAEQIAELLVSCGANV